MTAALTVLDVGVIVLALTATAFVGWWAQRGSAGTVNDYFLAKRSVPGWLLGTSMVATTFSADTPLVITGLIAAQGIAGNWIWWSLGVGHVLVALVFARLWRRAQVVTDAEFIALRYGGAPARLLRRLRAFYFAIPVNCLTLAWVFRAMGKIAGPLLPWERWIPASIYRPLAAAWPANLGISTPSEALTVFLGFVGAVAFVGHGGLRSVLYTDVLQFGVAMFGSILLAVYALDWAGGPTGLVDSLRSLYGPESAERTLALMPSHDGHPSSSLWILLAVSWWAHKYSDGGGALVQRLSSARDEREAVRGAWWFVVAHYCLRPWPWIVTGLVALVAFPAVGNVDGATDALTAWVAEDRELGYPAMMLKLLPSGALGLMIAGLLSAFMSTVDTHVHWGASYIVNDLAVAPSAVTAGEAKGAVALGRMATWAIGLLAFGLSFLIQSITEAWQLLMTMGVGLGFVSMARWFWWRINVWSEFAGLTAACLAGVAGSLGLLDHWSYGERLGLSALGSVVAVVGVTLATPSEDRAVLARFVERVHPPGFWPKALRGDSVSTTSSPIRLLLGLLVLPLAWIGGRELLFGSAWVGSASVLAFGVLAVRVATTTETRRVGLADSSVGRYP